VVTHGYELASIRIRWKIARMDTRKAAGGRVPALLVIGAVMACSAPDGDAVTDDRLSDDLYVQVMTELLLLDASLPDERMLPEREAGLADSLRADILAAHKVTAEEILDFADQTGSEAGRMEDLWERITHIYDSTRVADLQTETEARSEPEGKLGEEARAEAAARQDSTGAEEVPQRIRDRLLERRMRSRPEPPDTTSPQR